MLVMSLLDNAGNTEARLCDPPDLLSLDEINDLKTHAVYPGASFIWSDPLGELIVSFAEEIKERGGKPQVRLLNCNRQWGIALILKMSPGNEVWLRQMISDKEVRSTFGAEVAQLVFIASVVIPARTAKRFQHFVKTTGFFQLEIGSDEKVAQYFVPFADLVTEVYEFALDEALNA